MSRLPMLRRAGFTLIELLVTLMILSIGLATVGLAIGAWDRDLASDAAAHKIAGARAQAIATGLPVRIRIEASPADSSPPSLAARPVRPVTALPDGRVLADSTFAIDGLSGRPRERNPQ